VIHDNPDPALVSRINRRIPIRIVRFCRSTGPVQWRLGAVQRETLLQLEPEDIAPLILEYLIGLGNGAVLHRHNFIVDPDLVALGPELQRAVTEGWMWLEAGRGEPNHRFLLILWIFDGRKNWP
jgi:hypothetical protein